MEKVRSRIRYEHYLEMYGTFSCFFHDDVEVSRLTVFFPIRIKNMTMNDIDDIDTELRESYLFLGLDSVKPILTPFLMLCRDARSQV